MPEVEIAEALAGWWRYFLVAAYSPNLQARPFSAFDPEGFRAFNSLSADRRFLVFRAATTLMEI